MAPGLEKPADEPTVDTSLIDLKSIPGPVRAELRALPKDLATVVMAHMMAAGELIESDPALAQAHAMAARRRAARLPLVREVAAETAYANGDYATALAEYRAVARMTGNDDYLPVIADCERALGKFDQALRTIRDAHQADLDEVQQVELVLVEAGLRDDMGQRAESLRLLREAIRDRLGPKESQARLRYAYANLLQQEGNDDDAVRWFEASQALDVDADLDSDDRLRDLGVDVPEKEPDFDEEDYLLIQEEAGDPEFDTPTDDDAERGSDQADVGADRSAEDDSDQDDSGSDNSGSVDSGGIHANEADSSEVDPGRHDSVEVNSASAGSGAVTSHEDDSPAAESSHLESTSGVPAHADSDHADVGPNASAEADSQAAGELRADGLPGSPDVEAKSSNLDDQLDRDGQPALDDQPALPLEPSTASEPGAAPISSVGLVPNADSSSVDSSSDKAPDLRGVSAQASSSGSGSVGAGPSPTNVEPQGTPADEDGRDQREDADDEPWDRPGEGDAS